MSLTSLFVRYGALGMGLASFLAGTFVPFSSEAVMGALVAVPGARLWPIVLAGTAGNVAGMWVNYGIGRLATPQWIQRRLHIRPAKMDLARRWCERYGTWSALLCFLPFVGTVIAVVLGLMRTPLLRVTPLAALGMFVRYVVVAYSVAALA